MSERGRTRICVTGAAGVVGRKFVARMHSCFDVDLKLYDRLPGTIGDLPVEALKVESQALEGIDVLVHLAALLPGKWSAAEYRQINARLPVEIARCVVEAGVKRIVFVSSLHVHGISSVDAVNPDSPFAPIGPYAHSKAEAELHLKDCLSGTGVDLRILRPPVIYGGGRNGKLVSIVKAIAQGIPLPLGCANNQRSMISIDNVIDALVHLTTDKNSECRVLIPADSNDLTMRELAVTIGKIVGREARLVPVPRGLARAMLRPLGRHVAANIFGDLRVDRSHWSSPPWTAPESVEVGLARALSFQVNN